MKRSPHPPHTFNLPGLEPTRQVSTASLGQAHSEAFRVSKPDCQGGQSACPSRVSALFGQTPQCKTHPQKDKHYLHQFSTKKQETTNTIRLGSVRGAAGLSGVSNIVML